MATDRMIKTCETLTPIVICPEGSIVEEAVPPEVADFLMRWQPSSHPTKKDETESERIKRRIRAKPKRCWFNARKAVQTLGDYADASYVEGWAVLDDGFMIEHGWVVRDGRIIDRTLPTKPYRYFPGLEFRGRAGIAEFLATPSGRKCKQSPYHYAFGWGGEDSPSYSRSFNEALEYCDSLCSGGEASQ